MTCAESMDPSGAHRLRRGDRMVPDLCQAFGFRISGFGSSVSGFRLRVAGFGLRVSGFGFRVSGFGFRV